MKTTDLTDRRSFDVNQCRWLTKPVTLTGPRYVWLLLTIGFYLLLLSAVLQMIL